MKRLLGLLMVMGFAAGAWAQQSLGEIARKNRAHKKPAAIIHLDDDNMPRTLNTNPDEATTKDAATEDQAEASDKAKKETADSSKEQKEKLGDEIKTQKDQIALLQRELDVDQREQRLKAAAFYADAGTQMRDQAKFAEDSRKQQEEADTKKQALEAAQQKLADMEEQARKAGLPPSARE
jgi:hypothetical protein